MSQFGNTPEYWLWKVSFAQFFMWHDRAVERVTGNMIDRQKPTLDPNEIKKGWTWTKEKGWTRDDG